MIVFSTHKWPSNLTLDIIEQGIHHCRYTFSIRFI